jgi:hypothetical protein
MNKTPLTSSFLMFESFANADTSRIISITIPEVLASRSFFMTETENLLYGCWEKVTLGMVIGIADLHDPI